MSSGLAALEREQWETARGAFERAAKLKPGAPEVADGLARAAAGQRRELLINSTRRAEELEREEAWHEAEKTYASVLAADPEAAAALDGRDRSAARATLDDKIRYHLSNPSRLASPPVLEDASVLLEEAQEASPRGPRLTSQLRRLEELIETATRPFPVVIESDDLTDVVVHHVGRLGTFSRREINLRPGTYTAVGSRTGFRDVRVRFEVVPGRTQPPVVVRCTENL
jgi:tetratricopeptide (TPR) repeat protein